MKWTPVIKILFYIKLEQVYCENGNTKFHYCTVSEIIISSGNGFLSCHSSFQGMSEVCSTHVVCMTKRPCTIQV